MKKCTDGRRGILLISMVLMFCYSGLHAQKYPTKCFSREDSVHVLLSNKCGQSGPFAIYSILNREKDGIFTFRNFGTNYCIIGFFIYHDENVSYFPKGNIQYDLVSDQLNNIGYCKAKVKKAIKRIKKINEIDCDFRF